MHQRFSSGVTGPPARGVGANSSGGNFMLYIILLIIAKFFKAAGLFIAYDLLKIIPVAVFLCFLKFGTAVPLILLQKPFSNGPSLSKHQWFRVWRHAVFGCLISYLWMFGLTQCGPLRSIILFEQCDQVVLAGAAALFTSGQPHKSRGAMIFISGVVSLLLFDHDEKLAETLGAQDGDRASIHSHTIINHFFKNGVDHLGWSDHKGGVLLLFLTLCLNSGYTSASRKLQVEVGGAKRLHSLSTLLQSVVFVPWAYYVLTTQQMEVASWASLAPPLALVVLCVGVVDFYLEGLAQAHLPTMTGALMPAIAVFSSALLLSATWTHPLVTRIATFHKIQEIVTEDHVLSAGVLFSVGAFLLATRMLMSRDKAAKGSFIGYNHQGAPLYSMYTGPLQKTKESVMNIIRSGLKEILAARDSKRIFYFLCINLAFTFVELAYGIWTNSLGLIADGFHMFFDCAALVMGLYASIMARWKATRVFSYGYDRVEVLSGFINGLFLVIIAMVVLSEAVMRILEPPEISTDRLLTVSVGGLLVNFLGILAFDGHGHSHGGVPCGGHGHSHGGGDHGHSHGGDKSHGHSHNSHGHSHEKHGHSHDNHGHSHDSHGHSHGGDKVKDEPKRNTNMEGVFLHVLADTLGSVGVIVSTLLIDWFGWYIADPLCSLFIGVLIFLSVLPLLKNSAAILTLRTPYGKEEELGVALNKLLRIEGVESYRSAHFWAHTGAKTHGTIHVQVDDHVQEQKIIPQVVSIFKEAGVSPMNVQTEKKSYFLHLAGLGGAPVNLQGFYDQRGYSKVIKSGKLVKTSKGLKLIKHARLIKSGKTLKVAKSLTSNNNNNNVIKPLMTNGKPATMNGHIPNGIKPTSMNGHLPNGTTTTTTHQTVVLSGKPAVNGQPFTYNHHDNDSDDTNLDQDQTSEMRVVPVNPVRAAVKSRPGNPRDDVVVSRFPPPRQSWLGSFPIHITPMLLIAGCFLDPLNLLPLIVSPLLQVSYFDGPPPM